MSRKVKEERADLHAPGSLRGAEEEVVEGVEVEESSRRREDEPCMVSTYRPCGSKGEVSEEENQRQEPPCHDRPSQEGKERSGSPVEKRNEMDEMDEMR